MENPRARGVHYNQVHGRIMFLYRVGFALLAPALLAAPSFDQVRSIFAASCVSCHGAANSLGGLRLDSPEAIARGGAAGPLFTPGRSTGSRLLARLTSANPKERMPMGAAPLKPAEIAAVREWIDGGAQVPATASIASTAPRHWAYRKPVKPAPPAVRGGSQVRNPVDRFLLARLEKQGLSFNREAPRETLIRRLSLDLTGLPPTPQQVAAFSSDTRPDAYEHLVDELLKSPRYGERWARPWLDLARYADTNGFEADRRRTMWRYRDWVIDALNADMPFDQFTIEQLAGDMLPNPTVAQKIATGFHRNTMFNEEGGVDREEAHFEVLVDRVNTTASTWLGATLMCSQCHNHKYDPFTQKEYYQLMAFFSQTTRASQNASDAIAKWREKQIDLATAEQETRRKQITGRIASLEAKLKTSTPELEREQQEWETGALEAARAWRTFEPSGLQSAAGAQLAFANGFILATGENAQRETYTLTGPLPKGPLTALRIEAKPHASLPRNGPGRDIYGNFILTSVAVEIGGPGGWKRLEPRRVVSDDGRVEDRNKRQLWTIDASREEKRLARQLVLVLPETEIPEGAQLRLTLVQNSDFVGQSLGHFAIATTASAGPERPVRVRAKLRPAFESATRTEGQKTELAEFFRGIAPSLEPVRDLIKELRNDLDRMGIASALVMEEPPGFERPSDFIRTRGLFSAKAGKVYADVPAVLGALPPDSLPNRLGLARWLVSRENPLTARVAVNRMWEQFFGRGIVETSEDFGTMGERPLHPELLDWLATEFMDRNWSQKAMHRLIVTSAAYRQSSAVTPPLLEADPYNRLISRGPRFRLEAEMVRDAALAASGLLSARIGGPSVFPPQPEGVWDVPYSDERWIESKGEDRYRRALYTFLRRSALYPAMMNFDATSHEVCTVRRVRTNTPLQALTTLNDQAFFEAARALAARIAREGGTEDRARATHGFRLVASRAPSAREMDRLLSWLAQERRYFETHVAEATRLAGGAEMAAWTVFANALLNLDEALTKE
ncbi:MAG: DUF1553 domain-containing protein [Acidobacteria bacterium]|nr:DUF1553 domain-containing protein [Acidobacteriota bacterium]